MGNITGAMVFQSTIPTVVALVFASSTLGRRPQGSLRRLRVGRDRVPVVGGRSSSRWPGAGVLHGRRLLVGGVFYVVYLALVLARRHRRHRRGRRDPLIYSADRNAGARSMLTEKPDASAVRPPRPDARPRSTT